MLITLILLLIITFCWMLITRVEFFHLLAQAVVLLWKARKDAYKMAQELDRVRRTEIMVQAARLRSTTVQYREL